MNAVCTKDRVAMPTNWSDDSRGRNQGRRAPMHARMRLAMRVGLFALIAVVLALMYQGERWMLERPGPAPDPSLIATCALNAVGDLPGPTCVSKLIR